MDPTIPEEDSSFDTNITTDNITNDATPMAAITVTLPTAAESEGYTVTANGTPTAGADFTFKVEAKTGYDITKVQYAITTKDGEAEPVTAPAEDAEGTAPDYKVPAAKITETTTAIAITVTAAKKQYDLVVKVDEKDGTSSAANLDTLTYSAGGQTDVAISDLATPIKITHDDTLTLKVVPKDGYAVEVKNGTTKLDGTAEGVYTVGKVTADVTINITTSKNKFTVTEDITKAGDPAAALAVIAYQNNCVADNKIAKNTDLAFKVNPPTGGSFDGKKVIVSYTVGAAGTEESLTANKDGVYTIPKAKITDDVTIKVVVRDKTNVTVTLDAGNTHVEKVEYSTATPDSWTEISGGGASIPEDTTVRIRVTAAKYYKVKTVKFGDAALTLNNGTYSFVADKTAAIAVETELDTAQCNKFTYKLTGDPGSVTASISISENSIAVEEKSNIKVGEQQILAGDTVVLKLTPKTGYKITKVGSETKNATDPLWITYTFTESVKAQTVAVLTAPVANETAKAIRFHNQAAHMSYRVTGDSKVTQSVASSNTIDDFIVGAGAERLQFTVTAQGPYKPVVKQGEMEIDKSAVNGAVYSYIIPAATLSSGDTINIAEEVIEHTVTLKEDFANADILASVDGKMRATDQDTTDKYTLKENETIAFRITPKDGYKLVSVTSQVGTAAAKTEKLTNGVANLEVKLTADVSVTVKTEEIYTVSGLKKGGDLVPLADAKKNAYNVSYDGTYTIDVTKGASMPAALKAVKVFSGRNLVAEKTEGTAYATVSGGTATIDLAKAKDVAGTNGLTVKLYVAGETAEDEVELSTTLTLNVSALVKDIKINNKATLAVNQAIDMRQTYKVTAAKGVELSKLVATSDANSILAENGVSYDGTTGTLTVITKAAKPAADAKATITVHEDGKNGANDPKAVLTVTPVDLVPATTKAPGVKLVAATDVSLKLALSTSVKENPATGKLYYKVETQEMDTAVKPAVAVENTQKTTYVLKGTGLSQEAVIAVAGGDLGSGTAKTYEVKASLVHLDKEAEFESNGSLKTEIAILGTSAASKAQNLKTQTPAYEDKLKLKKSKTTLATGEKQVIVATPQFSKYATYLSLANSDAVKDLSYTGDLALTFTTPSASDNYVIKASATEDTALGKHKIQVTASAETGALPSVATVDVTVVRGIHDLDVAVPSTNLYKANKKAATLKATAVYNEDTTGKDKDRQPKNKKVDWAVVAVDRSGDVQKNNGKDVLFTGASVKNGTVTVDKNYIIKGDHSDQFKIRVTAQNTEKSYAGKDENGKAIVGYSEVITITNEGEDIKGLVLVDSNSRIVVGGGTAKFPTKVEATDLSGCQLVVLNSKAPSPAKDTTIEAGHKLDYSNFTVKCSQKGLLGDNGVLSAVSKMGKVTFTATANDGSKKKAELGINIINDDTKNKALSLKVQKALYQADGTKVAVANGVLYSPNTAENPDGATAAKIDFDGSTTPLVAVTLVMADAKTATENWAKAPKYANYKLSVSGGGKIVEKGITTYIAITNNKDVVVTLEDPVNSTGSNKIKDTFTLKNKATTEAPKFTAGKLKSVGKFREQTASIKVEKMAAAVEGTAGLKAKIEVDWSAANAKNLDDLKNFQNYLENSYDVTVEDVNSKKVGTIDFALKGTPSDSVTLPQSSYKLKITLGTVAGDVFTAVTTPVAVTVKVDKAKAFTFTPATSYTLFTKDQNASTPLTGKTNAQENEYNVTYTTLLNANVKGVTNDFTEYFEIADDKIQLKSGKKIGDITKANLTGYLTYTAMPTVGYYTLGKGAGVNTVKITIKFNESKTVYTYSQIKTNNQPDEITKASGSTVDVKIGAKLGKVLSDAKLSGVAVGTDNTSKLFSASVKTDGQNIVTLTYNGTEALNANAKYTVNLYLLPTDSRDKAAIAALGDADKTTAIIAKNIKVPVQLKAVEARTPLETAQQKLTAWIAAQNTAKPTWLKNGLTSTDLLNKIKATEGGAGLDTGVTVTIAKKETDASADDYDNTTNKATVAVAGKITGTFKISITGTETAEGTLAFELTVPKGAITKDEAETVIKEDSAVKAIAVTNEDITDAEKKSAKEAAILAAAKTALGDDTYYTVTVKANAGLTQTQAATNEAAGSATITLEIKETGNTGDTAKEVVLTYTISQLTGA